MWYWVVVSGLLNVFLVGLLHAPSVEGMRRILEVPGDGSFRGACLWLWRMQSGSGDQWC